MYLLSDTLWLKLTIMVSSLATQLQGLVHQLTAKAIKDMSAMS